jgi:pyrimidine-specific ribonucleoside hydrolase
VSVTYGEAHPQVYIQHLGRMLDDFGFTGIPLGEGQDAPLPGGNPFPEWMRQDANGFWSMPIPNADRTYPAQPAEQMIVSVLNAAPEPVTVFISGPCTSLALALRLDPGIKDHIKAVYIMGGAVHVPGNLGDVVPDPANSTAEWNIFADPQAAQLVLEAGLDLYLVPLDATNQVRVAPRDIQRWSEGGRIGGLAADFYSMLMKKTGLRDYAVWDGMTAAIMSDPALCGFELMSLQVGLERGPDLGRTMLVKAGAANVHVCLRPDVQAIKDRLAQRLGASR